MITNYVPNDIDRKYHLDGLNIRHFESVEEIREHLHTLTPLETMWCNVQMGISFTLGRIDGKVYPVACETMEEEKIRLEAEKARFQQNHADAPDMELT